MVYFIPNTAICNLLILLLAEVRQTTHSVASIQWIPVGKQGA
jgi:hypothetical protein